jgi:hypothetical protein
MTAASAANFRRTVNRARRYHDPLPACALNPHVDPARNLVNVTGIAGVLSAEFRATRHGENGPLDAHRAAAYAVANLEALAAHDPGDAHAAIVRAAKADLAAAADRGTAVHELVECELLGRPPLMLDPAAEPYRETALAFLEWFEPEVLLIEAAVFSWADGYAGTLDALLRSRRLGRTFLVDWKSRGADSGHGCYEKEVAQLGLLARCDYVMVERLGITVREELPEVDACAVVSLRPDSWAFYEVPRDQAEKAGAQALVAYEAREDSKKVGRRSPLKPLTADGGPVPETPAKAAAKRQKAESNLRERAATLAAAAREALPADEVGRKRFLTRWGLALPGVATPKGHDGWTLEDVEAVERFLAAPFGDAPAMTPDEVAAVDAVEVVADPPARLERAPEDHGGPADPVAVAMLVDRLKAAPEGVRAWQVLWRSEGDAAGISWRMGPSPTVRSHAASLAAWWLAKLLEQSGAESGGEEDVRRILATVVGDAAEFVTTPVGAVLGALTLDEAAMAVTLAENSYQGNVRITDAGRVEVAA